MVLAGTVEFKRFRSLLTPGLGYSDGTKGGLPEFDPVAMFKALMVHTPCSATPWSNGLAPLHDETLGALWHLNPRGHQAIADLLYKLLNRSAQGELEPIADGFSAEPISACRADDIETGHSASHPIPDIRIKLQ